MSRFRSRLATSTLPVRIALRLGPAGARLKTAVSLYRVLLGIALRRRAGIPVRLSFQGKEFSLLFESSADFALVREVFLDGEYRHERIPDPKTIFDVGANVGVAGLYFHCRYPDAVIYAFEPDPALFAKLAAQVGHTRSIVPLRMALADKNGTVPFYPSPSPLAGSLVRRKGALEPINVPVRTIASAARELGIANVDLLKFDIEGAEGLLFASKDDRMVAKRLIGEVHFDLLQGTPESFRKLLPEFAVTYPRAPGASRAIVWAERHTP